MSKSTIFITLEFICGLLLGYLGGHLFSLYDNYSLFSSIGFTFLSIYAGALLAIWTVGFVHLKTTGRINFFAQAIIFSFLGLVAFLIIYITINILAANVIPYYPISVVLPVILPIAGAVTGFNYKILKSAPIHKTR